MNSLIVRHLALHNSVAVRVDDNERKLDAGALRDLALLVALDKILECNQLHADHHL